jgi:hypothetical protein
VVLEMFPSLRRLDSNAVSPPALPAPQHKRLRMRLLQRPLNKHLQHHFSVIPLIIYGYLYTERMMRYDIKIGGCIFQQYI